MIELHHLDLNSSGWIVADPSELLRLLEIFVRLIHRGKKFKGVADLLATSDGSVAPFHQGDLLTDLHILGILFLNEQVLAVYHSFLANGVLRMKIDGAGLRR